MITYFETDDTERRLLRNGADRIDQAGRHRDVERTCGELLHQIGARLHVDNVDLEILRREEPLVDADEHRPDVRRGRTHGPDRDGVSRARGSVHGPDRTEQQQQSCDATQRFHLRPPAARFLAGNLLSGAPSVWAR